ncbi:MAG: hypothetical protein M9931_11200 [Chitinophagales bacterium]|nr:hypothetical protein [Chitinophagales bacterium]MCO5281601.1 hypothetical protein [Chitinophagales bacterium]OJV27768.1 MAG: hypothetical protein BGO32_10960 [Bacteroidetes bacterium 37-13]HRN94532.1 hypothetical protein [Chitinophagales bacterium]HRP38465.1 hypothetical protein [Chitinophagales bacterium]
MSNDWSNVKCPNCGSQKFLVEEKNFNTGRFLGAYWLTNSPFWGVLAGNSEAGKKIATCLNCKSQYNVQEIPDKDSTSEGCGCGCLLLIVIFICLLYWM